MKKSFSQTRKFNKFMAFFGILVTVLSVAHLCFNIFLLICRPSHIILINIAIILDAIFLIFSIVSVSLFFKFLYKDFNEFMRGMEKISSGDFSVRISAADKNNELATAFNRMAESLDSLELMKRNFVSDFSHDFKTPIASIQGFARLLKNKNIPDDEKQEYIDIIIRECERLTHLAKSMITVNRVNSQGELFETAPFRADEQLRECIILYQQRIEEKNIDISLSSEPIVFKGNEMLVREIWLNLIDNAVKYTDANGHIEVGASFDGKELTVTVKDDGCGMDEETKANALKRYFKGKTLTMSEGFGVGLAIVERVLYLTKGSMTIDSEPGKGSQFTIVLPSAEKLNRKN